MKLRHSIYMMILLCSFLPVCIWVLFSVQDNRKRLEGIVSKNIEAIAGSQIMSIQNFCEGRKESLETLSRYEIIQDAILENDNSNDELITFLNSSKENKKFVVSLSVVDSGFRVIASSEKHTKYDISNFKYSDSKHHAGEFTLGNIYDRKTDNGIRRIIPAYTGIFYEDQLIGYIIEEIECTYFDRLRLNTDFLEDGTLYLLDANASLITAGTSTEMVSRKKMVTTPKQRANYEKAWKEFDHEHFSSGIIHYEYANNHYMTYFSDIKYSDWGIRVTENMSAQWSANKSTFYMIIFEGCIIACMLVIVQVFIAYKLVKPFNWMVTTLKTVQKNHDYSLRINLNRNDEIGMIADGIDDLLRYIEIEELEEKRKHRKFAEEAKDKAETSNRAKSTFLFNVSHDIRTPMNAIQGFAYIIEQNSHDSQIVKDNISKIKKSSQILMNLLNNVLELSKIESGKDELEIKNINLNFISDKLYTMFAREITHAGINFVEESEIRDSNVWTDELKCTRILMNMLSNATKFTNTSGTITYGIKQLSNVCNGRATYRIFVKDTGIGMSEEFQKRAFEQFETERNSTISGVQGNGLGLSIVKNLVKQLGGTCFLKSEQGKGTEISAEICFRVAECVSEQDKEKNMECSSFKGKKVLLVEDNELNREIARYVLEELEITVEEAEDGAVAVEKLRHAKAGDYDLVFMDIQMPVMDGYTATKMIRQLPDKDVAEIVIIAMTANAFKEDRDKCIEVGMNEHIAKPVDVNKLYGILKMFN